MENRFESIEERLRRTEENQTEILRRLDALMTNANRRRGRSGRDRSGRSEREHSDSDESDGRNFRGGGPRRDPPGRKLDLPIFSGDGAYGWLNRVERYFYINGMMDGEKIPAVLVVLEGEALDWYHWWTQIAPRVSWTNFRTELLGRFQPELLDNPRRELLSLKQHDTVADYRRNFERIVGILGHVEEGTLIGVWLNGLKDSIREELLMSPSIGLPDMIKMVHKI